MTIEREPLKAATNPCVHWALEPRLMLYALAAGATLAFSCPTQAQVVFTPSSAVLQGLGRLDIDLDHDGSNDFSILARWTVYDTSNMIQAMFASGNRGSDQVATGSRDALKFRKGEQIGPGQSFRAFALMETPFYRGIWNYNTESRSLGVRFLINGEIHYGWIGFRQVRIFPTIAAKLYGYAYETTPDKPILAGDTGTGTSPNFQPTSLEILASGHTAIEQRRKRSAH